MQNYSVGGGRLCLYRRDFNRRHGDLLGASQFGKGEAFRPTIY